MCPGQHCSPFLQQLHQVLPEQGAGALQCWASPALSDKTRITWQSKPRESHGLGHTLLETSSSRTTHLLSSVASEMRITKERRQKIPPSLDTAEILLHTCPKQPSLHQEKNRSKTFFILLLLCPLDFV